MTPALLDETLRVELWCDVVVALDNERLNMEDALWHRDYKAELAESFPDFLLPRRPRLR